ncbi:MAG TPA: DNA-binding protein [Gemmatimonadetes bacterium]|nr:DNA-binding protein [Gemmatimonadota bacterium]|tara:strand:- start:442 stop:648 length:207 start_codon:yes stop_codon:yes gene_type:complete
MDRIELGLSKDWISVADISSYMGVSSYVVIRQLQAGRLPGIKFGREWRVARQDFEDWLNRERQKNVSG